MATHDRRTVLAALGLVVPFGLPGRAADAGPAPGLRFRSFEDAVREAFASAATGEAACRRVEVGHSDEVRAGVQGCHNDRPFAGFPAGHLRIVRTGCEPGPVVRGVRLFVATVDVAVVGGTSGDPGRPFDFAAIPPAPVFTAPDPTGIPRPSAGTRRVSDRLPTSPRSRSGRDEPPGPPSSL